MRVFAVVGGTAAGKSTVCALWAERYGAQIIDADRLGHQALENRHIRAQIIERFGQRVVGADGRIDRRWLGNRVFSNVQHRHWLDALVHPEIGRRIRRRLRYRRRAGAHTILVDAALFLEARLAVPVDAVRVVTAPRQVRRKRLAARLALSDAEIEARLDSQPGVRSWTRRADVVLDPRGSRQQLEVRAAIAWRALQRVARRAD
jgi:dephospho-CoA kinase